VYHGIWEPQHVWALFSFLNLGTIVLWLHDKNSTCTLSKNIKFICIRRKTVEKCSASLTFLLVFKARTNKFGIFRQCIWILYLSLRKHLTLL
jgi:hypothetical protein